MSPDDQFGPQHTGIFDFTILFEQSILSLLPTALFVLVAPFRVARLVSRDACVAPGPLLWLKLTIILVYLGLQVSLLAQWLLSSSPSTRTSLPESILGLVEAIVIAATSYTEHLKSIKPSFLLNTYLLLTILLDVALARTFWLREGMAAIASVFTVSLVVKSALLVLEELPKRPLSTDNKTIPRETVAGVVNRGVFWWLNSLFWTGSKSIIDIEHLGPIDAKFDSRQLLHRLEMAWEQYNKETPFALMSCTFGVFKWQFLAGILPRLLCSAFNFAQPFLVTSVIEHVGQPQTEDFSRISGGLIGATALIYVGMAVTQAWHRHMTFQLLTMYRGALASLIFKKTLHLHSSSIKDAAPLTLMSTDIETMVMAGGAIHDLWASLLELPVGIYLLYRQIGIPCLFILLPTLLTTILGGAVAPAMGTTQASWNEAVQQRLSATNDMLSQIKGIKMVGLSSYFHQHIQEMRVKEVQRSIKHRILIAYFQGLIILSEYMTPVIIILAGIYWSRAEQGLSIAEAFTSLSLIRIASLPLLTILVSLMQVSSALGCFTRLQAYMKLEGHAVGQPSSKAYGERNSSSTKEIGLPHPVPSAPKDSSIPMAPLQPALQSETTIPTHPIKLENASFTAGEQIQVLKDISLSIPQSTLSMVVGRVGSGKSSLLKAIIGEVMLTSGNLTLGASSMAYCDQTPWLRNISIRGNILGSSHLDEEWLSVVIKACALDEDLSAFPMGDLTIVGSGGVALSGGQKHRVALARAVYSRQRAMVLDDVFNGLDTTTMHAVFMRLFGPQGLLRDNRTTVVLVTNQVNFLPLADHITMLEEGRVIHNQVSYNTVDPSAWGVIEREKDDTAGSTHAEKAPATGNLKPQLAIAAAAASSKVEADLARQTGDAECYKIYLRSWGTTNMVVVVIASVLYVGVSSLPQIWLRIWTQNGTATRDPFYVGMFVAFSFAAVLLGVFDVLFFILSGVPRSSKQLHKQLLSAVMRAPLSFFTNTDLGVTLNRFSQDMTLIDQALPMSFWGQGLVLLLGVLVQTGLIASGATYVAAAIPGCMLALYFIQRFYLRTSRQMRFLDIEAKAPLYTQFTEALTGLSTIRAFGWTPDFMVDNHERLNTSQKPFYIQFCLQRWLQVVLDLLVAGMAVVLVALALSFRGTTSMAAIGLAMVNLISFNLSLTVLISLWTELEASLGAIARLKWFVNNTPIESKEGETEIPPSDWPRQGSVEFRNVSTSYSDNSPTVLHDVSFKVQAGQKVGICGRSGSGKSSLILSILRLLELQSGSILIDDLDLATLSREEIRSHLTVIPQEPLKLTGSVRYNLDPNGAIQADQALISVLAKTSIWPAIESHGGLDADFKDLGFSAGQLQLFCLARALLSRASVVLLDEATSNVDRQTDQEIRRVVKEEMGGRTVLEVAHRLDIISDYDVIMVLGDGKVLEMGTPEELLNSPSSAYRSLREHQTL
ncbi:putative ABC multidrug transporter [Stachybotrys elegans]|uniref:ABC multidrug transporter n=1 Tax=Stachybotrys elegans TaxID=80388 RepID=A0A8K0WRG6_9HYPO|nr:putative ABC multidrug transporter [Stachybotrys elegans]